MDIESLLYISEKNSCRGWLVNLCWLSDLVWKKISKDKQRPICFILYVRSLVLILFQLISIAVDFFLFSPLPGQSCKVPDVQWLHASWADATLITKMIILPLLARLRCWPACSTVMGQTGGSPYILTTWSNLTTSSMSFLTIRKLDQRFETTKLLHHHLQIWQMKWKIWYWILKRS